MRLIGTNDWRKIWGKLEAAARCTALVLRPEARLRRSGALLEGVMTWVRSGLREGRTWSTTEKNHVPVAKQK
jgi:hypothetical protein